MWWIILHCGKEIAKLERFVGLKDEIADHISHISALLINKLNCFIITEQNMSEGFGSCMWAVSSDCGSMGGWCCSWRCGSRWTSWLRLDDVIGGPAAGCLIQTVTLCSNLTVQRMTMVILTCGNLLETRLLRVHMGWLPKHLWAVLVWMWTRTGTVFWQ